MMFDSAFTAGQRKVSPITLMMALQYVKTRRAAERIYWAERRGLGRADVLAAASRRMDDFNQPRVARCDVTSTTTSKENSL